MSDGRSDATSFGRCAGSYEVGRPGYPAAAVEWLLDPSRMSRSRPRVADVGAGTGKLTRALLAAGCEVVAVDPDRDMLQVLRERVPDVAAALRGSAESLPLEDGSVDVVTFGQAWHWVDLVGASREVGRVLRPGGTLGLLWNLRDDAVPWVSRLNAVMPQGRAAAMLRAGTPPVTAPFGELQRQTWRWTRPMTRDSLMEMARSRSFYITATPERQAAYERRVEEVLDEASITAGVTVALPYLTRGFRTRR